MFVDADRWLIPFNAFFLVVVTTFLVGAARSQAHPGVLVLLSALDPWSPWHLLRWSVPREAPPQAHGRLRRDDGAGTRHERSGGHARPMLAAPTGTVDRTAEHVTVQWDDVSDLDTLFLGGSASAQQYANTGLDGMPGMREDFAMYDVIDGDGLVAALRRTSGR